MIVIEIISEVNKALEKYDTPIEILTIENESILLSKKMTTILKPDYVITNYHIQLNIWSIQYQLRY